MDSLCVSWFVCGCLGIDGLWAPRNQIPATARGSPSQPVHGGVRRARRWNRCRSLIWEAGVFRAAPSRKSSPVCDVQGRVTPVLSVGRREGLAHRLDCHLHHHLRSLWCVCEQRRDAAPSVCVAFSGRQHHHRNLRELSLRWSLRDDDCVGCCPFAGYFCESDGHLSQRCGCSNFSPGKYPTIYKENAARRLHCR